MKMANMIAGALAAGLAIFGPPVATATAAVIVTVQEVGSNVVFDSTGSLDIDGLSPVSTANTTTFVRGTEGFVFGERANTQVDVYALASVPTNFGGTRFDAPESFVVTSPPDSAFGALISPQTLRLPSGYVSGTPLLYDMTFLNESFTSMELFPGTYVWTLENDDTVTLQIVATAVSAPSALALLVPAVVGLGVVRRRRRAG